MEKVVPKDLKKQEQDAMSEQVLLSILYTTMLVKLQMYI